MADIICRWRNGTPKTVVELVNSLPHEVMPIGQFRKSMETKWKGEFFHTVYQLACQLALYCEAEDGLYYPRFDHDINEAEAHRYLELWITHYYIPNPYVAKNGFKNLECPTYLIKSLYDYVSLHPGCDYATAYRDLFHDEAKNNDDIVRNYINRYSKVLSFAKDGLLSKTNINAQQIFSFMDRNNKKQFYDTFDLGNQQCLMDSYLGNSIEQKKQMFYNYLKSTGLSESSCRQYAFSHPFHEEVVKIIEKVAHKSSLFDVIDGWQVLDIHKQVCSLEGNKKQGNAWSASISNYKNFLDYLEVGIPMGNAEDDRTNDLSVSDYVNFKHILECFCAHLQYVAHKNDATVKGYDEYIKPFVNNGTFKKSGFGRKDHNIQKLIQKWEQCSIGKIAINVHAESVMGEKSYLHWKNTPHNVLAVWDGDKILSLKLVELKSKDERVPLGVSYTLDELGLYDGKEPNENLKKFYDAFADMLKNAPEQEEVSEELRVEPLTFADISPRQIIYYGAPGTGKSHTIKKEEDEGLICIRTTFHPDSDYSTFVGCYKPHKCRETGSLTYEFVPQAFLEAYTQAWQNPQKEIALVIEEINRGNCAQIFGDIFQLLDRDEDGWSTYPIKADTDIAEYLDQIKISSYSETMVKRYGESKTGYGYMALPPNMSILATMNTSDQSLFPIDSAFKRRWDWKYVPICQGKSDGKDGLEKGQILDWKIETSADNKNWWNFLRAINGIIESTTHSEDKELGFFFCKANEDGVISADKFVNKVVFYLWTDVFKTYGFRSDIFNKDVDGQKKLAFKDFFNEEDGTPNEDTIKLFVENVTKHLLKENADVKQQEI